MNEVSGDLIEYTYVFKTKQETPNIPLKVPVLFVLVLANSRKYDHDFPDMADAPCDDNSCHSARQISKTALEAEA